MRKIILLCVLAIGMMAHAQTVQTIAKPLKLDVVKAGTVADSVLVRGADKIVKFVPTSRLKGSQVNADWSATSGAAMILNKPIIPTVVPQVNADWNATSGVAMILNKPIIPTVVPQVNADWNATSGAAMILNKPVISGSGWSLTGNSIADENSNFIGTTNDAGLRFKVNNINAGWIGTTYNRNVSLGVNALRNGSSGSYCTAIGTNAMYSATSAQGTAFGYNALFGVTTGNGNIALGYSSGSSITTGGGNLTIGYEAGAGITTGNENISIGGASQFYPIIGSGNYNVFLGNRIRSLGDASSRNVIIGSYVGTGQDLSNHIILATGNNGNNAGDTRVIIDGAGKTNLLGALRVVNAPTFASNSAAVTGGLVVGDVYKTSTGQLMIVY